MTGKRIWYQSMIVMSDFHDYQQMIERNIKKYASEQTEVVVHGCVPGSFRANYPGPDIAFDVFYKIHSLQFLLAAIEAERQGYDAFVMGHDGSPLVREIRSLVDIPVVGYGDAAARIAGMFGETFGIMVFNVERIESFQRRYEDWKLSESYGGACPSGVTFGEVAAAYADPRLRKEVVAKVEQAGAAFVQEKGIDVIIPGEMPLNLLLADEGVSRIAGATVIDGLAVLMNTAEMLIELRRNSNMSHSRRGYYNRVPEKKRIEEIIDFYGLKDLQERIGRV